MNAKRLFLLAAITILVAGWTSPSPAEAQSRIGQQIKINGLTANGAYVSAPGGAIQSFTCDGPQQYTTPDGVGQGRACYESTTGMWLLNALPPAPAQPQVVYQPQAVVYPTPTVVYRPSPVVVYPALVRPVVVAPAYPPSVVLGVAAIGATSRIVGAAIARPPVVVHEHIVRPHVVVRVPAEPILCIEPPSTDKIDVRPDRL